MSVEIISLEAALTKREKNNHILLGNGFSRACFNTIFSYDSLFKRADFEQVSDKLRGAFGILETSNFEGVMEYLKKAAKLLMYYDDRQSGLSNTLNEDAKKLKEVLISTIALNHPACPNEIEDEKYEACDAFLSNFTKVYTLNYDLLLYWVIMHSISQGNNDYDDGFRKDHEAYYISWGEGLGAQNVFYMHGALHIFDSQNAIQKYSWKDRNIRLIDQIKLAMESDKFPLFVAEDTSNAKFTKILHNGFLDRSYRSFSNITGSLFIYGHSLAENDEHILRQVNKNKSLKKVFISIYGNIDDPGNARIIARANEFNNHNAPKEIYFYDAVSAKVWG